MIILEGGTGSGNHRHKGRPGFVGGSLADADIQSGDELDAYYAEGGWDEHPIFAKRLSDFKDFYNGSRTHTHIENSILTEYTALGYEKYNTYLRRGRYFSKDMDNEIEILRGCAEDYPIDTVVYRGINIDSYSRKNVGDVFEDKGFVSTSIVPRIAHKFSHEFLTSARYGKRVEGLVRIKISKGTKVIPMGWTEKELVLLPGTKFRVTKITRLKLDGPGFGFDVEGKVKSQHMVVFDLEIVK